MAEKHNLMSILQYAPKGLKLYSPCYGDIRFQRIEKDKIICSCGLDEVSFGSFGTISTFGECMIFPSKEYTSWYNWQRLLFSIGDTIKCQDKGMWVYGTVSQICNDKMTLISQVGLVDGVILSENHLSINDCMWVSPEEEAQFLEGLASYGIKLNKGKAEKIKPKFNVGDIITINNGGGVLVYQITEIKDGKYFTNCLITNTPVEIPEKEIDIYHILARKYNPIELREEGNSLIINNLSEERLQIITNLVNHWINLDTQNEVN